jgi:hypothetical protein
MSELIDREALKDAVKRYAGEPIKKKDRKCHAICLDMLGIIDAQPTASPWHRVESKENLPKESGTYIVYLRQGTKVETPEWMGGEPLSYVVEMAFDREQMLWRSDDDAYNAILSFVDTERDFHVTHWTEKPEPPKEIMNE